MNLSNLVASGQELCKSQNKIYWLSMFCTGPFECFIRPPSSTKWHAQYFISCLFFCTAAFWNEIVTAYILLAQCCLSVVLSLMSTREWVLLENHCAAEFLHTRLQYKDSYRVIYVMNSVSDTPVVRKQCLLMPFLCVDYL